MFNYVLVIVQKLFFYRKYFNMIDNITLHLSCYKHPLVLIRVFMYMGLRHLVHLSVWKIISFVNYQASVLFIIIVLSAVLEVHPLRSECRVCSLTWPSSPSQNLFSVTPRNPIMKPRANIPTPQFSHLAFPPLISKKNRHHIFDAILFHIILFATLTYESHMSPCLFNFKTIGRKLAECF